MRQTHPPLSVAHILKSVPELAPGFGHEHQGCVASRDVENGLGAVLTAGVEYTERLVEDLRLKDSAGTVVPEGLVVTLAGTERRDCLG